MKAGDKVDFWIKTKKNGWPLWRTGTLIMTGLYAHKVLPNGAAHAITVLSDHVEKALK